MVIKKLILATLLAVSLSAHAKGSSAVTSVEATSGIVTPDIATDGLRTNRFSVTISGETVFCPLNATDYSPRDSTCMNGKHNAWVYARQMVPPGKTYVGFKIVSGAGGYTYYEIYWK